MIILLSPAKTLNTERTPYPLDTTQADFRKDAFALASVLKSHKQKDIKKLMHISDKLADQNYLRFQEFNKIHTDNNSTPAIYTFDGGVYQGLRGREFKKNQLEFAQAHLRILSGMYGYLKPMDLMQPYRLEMGTKLKTEKGKDLYSFWDNRITKKLNKDLKDSNSEYVLNLASQEYFGAIQTDSLKKPVLDIHFRDIKDGEMKFVSFSAKKARGLMARYAIENKIMKPRALEKFNVENYRFDPAVSTEKEMYFVR